jgi:aryl-alcohol dehydrogenase-like predicted oxidoreductase
MPYDIIGDIHGQLDALERLLRRLGYDYADGVWRHPQRQALFLGDLIDRGPGSREAVATVRRMVAAGSARCVMGNHELNAIAYQTRDPRQPD